MEAIKVQLGELKSIIEGLQVLAAKDLPIKQAYWIGKTIPKLMKEFRDVEEARNKLCLKHCKKDAEEKPITKEKNGNKVYDMGDEDAFNKELEELWDMELDIEFTPIPIEKLEGVKIDTATMIKIDKFIVMEE
jgi:hypothetical protein